MGAKAKKNKGSTDNSVKKRKREQEEQQSEGAAVVGEPNKKKSKKVKKGKIDQGEAQQLNGAEAANAQNGLAEREHEDGANVGSQPVPKKSKKQKKDAVNQPEAAVVTEPAKKKPRKPKSTAGTQASVAVKTEAAPSTHTAAINAPSQNGTSKAVTTESEEELLQSHSPFVQETTSFYLALSPCAYDFPLEGLCAEHISPLLLTYYPPLKGIVLSYSNPRLSEHPDGELKPQASSSKEAKVVLSRSIDEYAVTYVWLTAEFTVFRPKQGTYLEGYVNLQNESILGLVCYNYFNAGIERSRLPKDWRWVGDNAEQGKGKRKQFQEGEGYFVNGEGEKVDGSLAFRVKDFEATAGSEMSVGSINIYGTLVSEEDDRRLDDEERQQGLVS